MKTDLFLPPFISDTSQGILRYVPKTVGLCLGGSLLGGIVGLVLVRHSLPPNLVAPSVLLTLFGLVVFSPVTETLALGAILLLLRRLVAPDWGVALCSATLWAAFHSLLSLRWGFFVFAPFYYMTLCYLAWVRVSVWKALGVTTLVHASSNLLPAVFLVLRGAAGHP